MHRQQFRLAGALTWPCAWLPMTVVVHTVAPGHAAAKRRNVLMDESYDCIALFVPSSAAA
jgi:hypothetical protein